MVGLKDIATLEFPRYLHKDGEERRADNAHDAVPLMNDGWTLRPGEPVATTKGGAFDLKKHLKKD